MLTYILNSAVAAVNSYGFSRESFAVLAVVGKNSILITAKSVCKVIFSADGHISILLHKLSRYARAYDKIQIMRKIAGICKYAGTSEPAAQLIGIPAAEALSHKYIIIRLHHIRKLFKQVRR